jgi:DNA polymerase-4
MTRRLRHIAHLHLHTSVTDDGWTEILETLSGITPHLHLLPPQAVQLDLTSALRFFGTSPEGLVTMIKFRLAGLFGIQVSAGLGPTCMLAAMACAESPPGRTTSVGGDQADVDAWLRHRPATALPGVGRTTAAALRTMGLHTIGQIADLPPATLQRVLASAPAARLLADRAHGRDPQPLVPDEPDARISTEQILDRDQIDPAAHHRAVLALAQQVGIRLRDAHQVCRRLILSIRYADRSTSTRSRALPEATAHSPALAAAALDMLTALALERARVRSYALRAEQLLPEESAHHQLTFEPGDGRARAAEDAADRVRRRFGNGSVLPAAALAQTGHRPLWIAGTSRSGVGGRSAGPRS